MKTINKDTIKNVVIFFLVGMVLVGTISAGANKNMLDEVAKDKIDLQEKLQKIKEDPITIYMNNIRDSKNQIDIWKNDIVKYKGLIETREQSITSWEDGKFCMEVQLNRLVNGQEIEDGFCDNTENIEALKKL